MLRDRVRGGEPVRVLEKRGSQGLRQLDCIAMRVIPLRQHNVISGTLMVFDHRTSEALLASLSRVRRKAPRDVAVVARELGINADEGALAAELSPDRLLGQPAFMFTSFGLGDALKAAQGLDRPEAVNAEGDPIAFTVLRFPLLPGVTAEQVRRALTGVPSLRQENAGFWNWLAAPGTKPKAVSRRSGAQTFISTMEDGALVLGSVSLKGRRLTLEANSAARAARGKALLEPMLAGLVGSPLAEHADLDQMLAQERPPPAPTGLPP